MYEPKSPAVDDAGELELRVDQQVVGTDGSVPNVEPTEVILAGGGGFEGLDFNKAAKSDSEITSKPTAAPTEKPKQEA